MSVHACMCMYACMYVYERERNCLCEINCLPMNANIKKPLILSDVNGRWYHLPQGHSTVHLCKKRLFHEQKRTRVHRNA